MKIKSYGIYKVKIEKYKLCVINILSTRWYT